MKDGTVVGHIPKKISSVCSLYLRRGGSIICRVTGSRRYSEDLIQGGLEIPCVLIFEGDATLTTKAKKLVVSALLGVASGMSPKSSTILLESKKKKLSDDLPEPEGEKWVQFATIVLTQTDKDKILMGEKLNDRHIDVAQGGFETAVSQHIWTTVTFTTEKETAKGRLSATDPDHTFPG